MPTKEIWVDPEFVLEHNGVKVFSTYKDDNVNNGPSVYSFTTDGSSDDAEWTFDVRYLNLPSSKLLEGHPPYLCETNPVYAVASQEQREQWGREWHKWQTVGEPEVVKKLIKEAIDLGLVKAPPTHT